MAKNSQVKTSRKFVRPIFHLQDKDEDDRNLTKGMIKVVKRTGHLNLSGRSLTTVPAKMFTMYDTEKETEINYDLSKSPDEPWWSFQPLTLLDLSSNVLQAIPVEIKMFEDLLILNLQDNSLTQIPPEIGHLTKLMKLNLSRNKIATIPSEVFKLADLQHLSLAHNLLESVPDDIGDLIMLQQLDLSHNNLTYISPGIGFLMRLTDINLSHNKLTELPPDISSLRVLQKLDVTHNNLTLLPHLSGMRKLQCLYAQYNDIEELPIMSGCENIEELYFGNNFIKEVGKDFCEDMAYLKILDLRDNKIVSLPNEIAMMQHLIRFDLTNNELETLPSSLSLLCHLQNFQIEGNKLKQIRSDIIKAGTSRIMKHLREKFDVENDDKKLACSNGSPPAHNFHTFPDVYVMKHSRALSQSGHDLTSIPEAVFEEAKKAEVTMVNFSKNKLTAVPEGLQLIVSNLSELNLTSNQIKMIPDYFGELLKLQYLDLSKNLLDSLPESLQNLKYLRELVISNNRFTSIPDCVYEMLGLEILQAGDNQITSLDVDGLQKLKRLSTFNIANNSINHIPPQLGNLKQLRSLELRGNSFRQPRYAILEQGTETILSYLRDRIPR